MVAAFCWRVVLSGTGSTPVSAWSTAIFILTFGCEFPALGKHAQHSQAPVVKEKWGIGVLFLAVAALCYILGQLGFISGAGIRQRPRHEPE